MPQGGRAPSVRPPDHFGMAGCPNSERVLVGRQCCEEETHMIMVPDTLEAEFLTVEIEVYISDCVRDGV